MLLHVMRVVCQAASRPLYVCAARPCSSHAARPLLQPPSSDDGPIQLNNDCGVNLDEEGVPTLAVIGPSRRGKSVLAGLLAGNDSQLFPQSHSSFRAMTSGTHIWEIDGAKKGGLPVRIVDTEGLSHVGRSRRNEALVRQFLISTYLTSSWVIWLDTEVLSSSFFNTMWLVYDYVADVLRVRDAIGQRLPRMMYVRTQETEVQRREYNVDFSHFGEFFSHVLEIHEDAHILEQMFAPRGICGHALPVWTVEDLDSFEASEFWSDGHSSAFKDSVRTLRGTLLDDEDHEVGCGPPLLALGSLQELLPKIARLEVFDPRDHELNKIRKVRGYMRAAYGRLFDDEASHDRIESIMNLFDLGDRDVRESGYRIDKVARARLEDKCLEMRLDVELVRADPEIVAFFVQIDKAADLFAAFADAFAGGDLSEGAVLRSYIQHWQLDPDIAEAAIADLRSKATSRYVANTGHAFETFRKQSLYTRLLWRLDDYVQRMRRQEAVQLSFRDTCVSAEGRREVEGPQPGSSWVWRLGTWLDDQKSTPAKHRYAVWTNGLAWALCVERHGGGGLRVGELREQGEIGHGGNPLPVPSPP